MIQLTEQNKHINRTHLHRTLLSYIAHLPWFN